MERDGVVGKFNSSFRLDGGQRDSFKFRMATFAQAKIEVDSFVPPMLEPNDEFKQGFVVIPSLVNSCGNRAPNVVFPTAPDLCSTEHSLFCSWVCESRTGDNPNDETEMMDGLRNSYHKFKHMEASFTGQAGVGKGW